MMNFLKRLLVIVCSVAAIKAHAQRWSYVYIQGDKQIPFYVKLEGEMLPRYSKNYCIIPQLDPGPIHLQILFQQNEFPAQNFTVLAPESGYRGFLLTRKDNTFALYDIQQRFYLYSGENGEDHLPELISVSNQKEPKTLVIKNNTGVKTPPKSNVKTNNENKPQPKTEDNEPQFLENIVLDNEHNVQPPLQQPEENTATVQNEPPIAQAPPIPETQQEVTQQSTENTPEHYNIAQEQTVEEVTPPPANNETNYQQAPPAIENNTAPIINSDCPQPLGDEDFDKIYAAIKDKNDDEKRVSYLMKKAENTCFTSRQVYFLAKEMQAESMRYSFLKKVFSHVTDQQNFALLEDHLFKTLEWKSYFRLIYQ